MQINAENNVRKGPPSVYEGLHTWKFKQRTKEKFIKAYKAVAIESNVVLFKFLKLI